MGGRLLRGLACGLWLVAGASAEAGSVRVLLASGSGPYTIETHATLPAAGAPDAALISSRVVVRAAGDAIEVDGIHRSERLHVEGAFVRVAGMRVRGVVEALAFDGEVAIVNELPLEHYVAGIVGNEMSPGWEGEALRAQAVASRTYALHQQQRRRALRSEDPSLPPWDLVAHTGSQVYRGIEGESASVRAAVEATEGVVLTRAGEPILAVFHSASGGRSASAAEVWGEPSPYLLSQPVMGEEDSPDTYWRLALSPAALARALERAGFGVGRVRSLRVLARSESGRVARLVVDGSRGSARMTGRELRRALGFGAMRSTLFRVRPPESPAASEFVFTGSGHGHGVGMSQWGARGLARQGLAHPEILASFYPGTRLVRWHEEAELRRAGDAPGAPQSAVSSMARVSR